MLSRRQVDAYGVEDPSRAGQQEETDDKGCVGYSVGSWRKLLAAAINGIRPIYDLLSV